MTRVLSAGDKINGYTIESLFGSGGVSTAYLARGPDDGRVFFKVFKSPTPKVPWYRAFVEYQAAMKQRIESTSLQNFLGHIVDFFEAPLPPRHTTMGYFQVFRFVEHGKDLRHFLTALQTNPLALSWERRLTWSKVFMASIEQMHSHGLVHGDLKPENLMLIADRGIKIGYRLRVIDIDYAIMTDRVAPWHGHGGYLGTPGYMSPEHLRGAVPEPASDVFTAGIILSELLGRMHPYGERVGADAYRTAIEHHSARRLVLDGRVAPCDGDHLVQTTHRMLDPDPERRPTARYVLDVLKGEEPERSRITRREAWTEVACGTASPEPGTRLALDFGTSFRLVMSVSTSLNRRLLTRAGAGFEYWDNHAQCTLERSVDEWFVVPNLHAPNETLHNGRTLHERARLRSGDELAVGRASRAQRFAPAIVSFE